MGFGRFGHFRVYLYYGRVLWAHYASDIHAIGTHFKFAATRLLMFSMRLVKSGSHDIAYLPP